MKKIQPGSPFIILLLGALTTISPFSIDMYLPAFGQIADDFNTTPAHVSLSVTSYFIGFAIGQIIYGPLLDRFGRKKPMYVGLAIYIVACMGCVLSHSVLMLIGFRFLQAVGGCAAMVSARAMVRDFFPVERTVRVFALLVLILGLSPLVAPTVGGFITAHFGWQWIFILLAVIVMIILLIVALLMPEGHTPDTSISLKLRPMWNTFVVVFREPQFRTYTLSGAFSFAALFIYVAGSPVIFLDIFHIEPQEFGTIFAVLAVGFIGATQLNIPLSRHYRSEDIFRVAIICQVIAGAIFLIGVLNGWFGLIGVIGMFFASLFFIGLMNPNAFALSLAPFTRNIGSAAALLGFLQVGVAGIASAGVGLINAQNDIPVVMMLSGTALIALIILLTGLRKQALWT